MMRPLYPLFIKPGELKLLVVGWEPRLTGRLVTLAEGGAAITLVCDPCPALPDEVRGRIQWQRDYHSALLADTQLLWLALADPEQLHQLLTLARRRGIWTEVVGRPELSSAHSGVLIDRAPLQLALTSQGLAPSLVRQWRRRLEAWLPPGLGDIARFMAKKRAEVKQQYPDRHRQSQFWLQLLGRIGSQQNKHLPKAFSEQLAEDEGTPAAPGKVALIGAGCGGAELLTLGAYRRLLQAQVVIYDRLVSDEVLALIPETAERLYVGKSRAFHCVPQDEINRLIVERARAGARVVRLKGGDGFVFGRGGEELQQLADAGIAFEVMPGITSALGATAYAGIPLTHRDHAQSCVFVTAHTRNGRLDLNWHALAQPRQTVVFYMGLNTLGEITRALRAEGMAETTPFAVIERGARPEQRVLVSTLKDIVADVAAEQMTAPSLLVMGEVVRLRKQLRWFD